MRTGSLRALIVAAFVVTSSLGFMVVSGPAGAAANTTCTSFSAVSVTDSVSLQGGTLGGCTVGTTGGSGVFTDGSPPAVNWSNGASTVFDNVKGVRVKAPTCPSGDSEMGLKGQVVVSLSTPPSSKIKGKTSADLCFDPGDGNVTLAPGTEWRIFR
jgi:hypothetical protein